MRVLYKIIRCRFEKMSLPLKPVKQLLGQHWPNQISEAAAWELKSFLEQVGVQIGREAVIEFEKLNERREKLGIPRLKRLNAWAVKQACRNVLKQDTVSNLGLQLQDVVNPGGNNMSTETEATKSASMEVQQ